MLNLHRGDVAFEFDGRTLALRLTLGGLARLESALGTDDLSTLAGRLGGGRLKTDDILQVLAAGLSGAGIDVSVQELGRKIPASRLAPAALAAARLLATTLGQTNSGAPAPATPRGEGFSLPPPPPQAGPA